VDHAALPTAVEDLSRTVFGIKSRADRAAADALRAAHVDVSGADAELYETITERWLRAPGVNFVYSVRY
jgi:hypothetical protein